MSKRILAERSESGLRLALMADNDLMAYAEDETTAIAAEQVYLCKADRIMPGMEACFVRLTDRENGFLPFSECREKPRSGDRFLVQVKKPPIGDKAAYVTRDISLAGRYVILTPLSPILSVSRRLSDENERLRLLALADRIVPKGMGLIMRNESAGAEETVIAAELAQLREKWRGILEKAEVSQAPCPIADREAALTRMIRDEQGQIDEIVTNAPDLLPDSPLPVRICETPFALYGVESKLKKSLSRKVWLPCGGCLVIDPTEAMTVIDVNSGKFLGGKAGAESAFLQLNLEAAREIARLLRLRGIGGVIIVDFVDMREEENRAKVQSALQEYLLRDPVKTVVHGFTKLGLMELTRKKTEGAPSFNTHGGNSL